MLKLNYAAALSDFQRAYELLKVAVPSEVSPVLVKIARCRLCLGSHSSALLAIQEALALDPTHDAARTLKRRLMQMQESEEALRQARAAARWHVARSTWEACIQLYEEENCPVPTGLRCWKVDLAVLERDWERAQSAAECVTSSDGTLAGNNGWLRIGLPPGKSMKQHLRRSPPFWRGSTCTFLLVIYNRLPNSLEVGCNPIRTTYG